MITRCIDTFFLFIKKMFFLNKHSCAVDKTSAKWGKSDQIYVNNGFKVFWETLEDVKTYQSHMMSDGKDLLQYAVSFFPEGKLLNNLTGLNIGCNFGEYAPPVSMAKSGLFSKIVIVDISEELLTRQSDITNQMGLNNIIEYKRMDLNRDSLQGNCYYDFIFALGTIHHIQRLEGLFRDINRVLKTDGIFCMREYIGPSYLQFNDQQIDIVNQMLAKIPDHLKIDINGNIKNCAWKATLEEILADDPSEAVRSSEIMEILKMHLQIKQCNMTGGTLLDSLLHGIADNFEKSSLGREILGQLICQEKELIEKEVIQSDYVFLVAEKEVCER